MKHDLKIGDIVKRANYEHIGYKIGSIGKITGFDTNNNIILDNCKTNGHDGHDPTNLILVRRNNCLFFEIY